MNQIRREGQPEEHAPIAIQGALRPEDEDPIPVPPPPRRFIGRSAEIAAGWLLLIILAYTVYNYEVLFNQGIPCSIPLVCGNHRTHIREPRFEELVQIQIGFEPLLDTTGYGINMAADVKKSQGALQDLSTLVLYSNMKSKKSLNSELRAFAKTAKQTSRQLIKWDNGVGGGVDLILYRIENSITAIQSLDQKEKEKSIAGSIFSPSDAEVAQRLLMEEFDGMASVLKSTFQKIRELNFATMAGLEKLDSHLNTILDLITQEKGFTERRKEEVLEALWRWTSQDTRDAKLSKAGIYDDLELLSKVDKGREAATKQIEKMNLHLDTVETSLERLKEDISKPLIARNRRTPLESHLGILEKGFMRLSDIRSKAKLRQDTVYDNYINGPRTGI